MCVEHTVQLHYKQIIVYLLDFRRLNIMCNVTRHSLSTFKVGPKQSDFSLSYETAEVLWGVCGFLSFIGWVCKYQNRIML